LKVYKRTEYKIYCEKAKNKHSFVFISDLHNIDFGEKLIKDIEIEKPEIIIIGGDVFNKAEYKNYGKLLPLLKALSKSCPVYYVFGNHEIRARDNFALDNEDYNKAFSDYMEAITSYGIHVLNNEKEVIEINGDKFNLIGLNLLDNMYSKLKLPEVSMDYLSEHFSGNEKDAYNILITHNPSYSHKYKELDSELILAGHTHGGLVRFPFIGSIISPELKLFPEFDGGLYNLKNNKGKESMLIVNKGLGYHTYPIRLNDRAEYVCLSILPCN